ncbi:unnamed protein product [Closterium sp. Yama58-4]|nr:unnamed protein product [Closterium sp. Yama58-4]
MLQRPLPCRAASPPWPAFLSLRVVALRPALHRFFRTPSDAPPSHPTSHSLFFALHLSGKRPVLGTDKLLCLILFHNLIALQSSAHFTPTFSHSSASLRASPSQRSCELCTQPAALRCDADSAFLCAACDAAVHSANFIVLRHSRHLLCALCSSPTSWEAPSPFQQPAAAAQTQVLCDSCLAVGAVSGITGNAVFHTPSAMSASMAVSLLPLHTYAAALSSSAFVPSPPSNVAPESQSLAKRHKANPENLLAFAQYPPHAKLLQMQSSAAAAAAAAPFAATRRNNPFAEQPGTLSQQQPALAQSGVVADVAGVVPDLNESLCNENQTVPDASTGKGQRQEEHVAGQAQNVLGGSCANGQGRNVLGQLAAARLKRVLSSWYARLALRGPHVSDLAFHIFQKVLRKLQPGRVAADSLRVTLAACMWTAAKLDDNQKTLPRASDVAAVARVSAQRLQAAELEVMKLVDWRPLEGFTGFQE